MAELAPHLPRQLKLQDEDVVGMSIRPTSVLTPRARTAIYELWAKNIGPLVKGTSMDDDEPTKREEMFDPTMRFILLLRPERLPVPVLASTATSEPGPSDHDTTAGDAPTSKSKKKKKKKKKAEKVDFGQEELVGYCSFRFDTEETLDDERRVEVVYCYELQLAPDARGKGLGGALMAELEGIGHKLKLEKSMLTCMRNNKAALRFYQKSGYIADEIDPMRMMGHDGLEEDGEVRKGSEIDYRILSKSLA